MEPRGVESERIGQERMLMEGVSHLRVCELGENAVLMLGNSSVNDGSNSALSKA
jgi:hypothetical protein